MLRLDSGSEFSGLSGATQRLAQFAQPFWTGARGSTVVSIPGIQPALQEIAIDLYDGFLSKEDRSRIGVDNLVSAERPPRVELEVDPESPFPHYEKEKHVIRLAAWVARPSGLLAWVALAHETSGHAVLQSYGLERRLRKQVGKNLPKPWNKWFTEIASDCMGILNLGPTMAFGSIAAWRALGLLTGKGEHLPCSPVEPDEVHPPPTLRAYIMAHLTTRLSFTGAPACGQALKDQIRADLERCKCGKKQLEAAEEVVGLLVEQRHAALNDKRFLDLQNWKDSDQEIAETLQQVLLRDEGPTEFAPKQYAAHALAAAIYQIVTGNQTEDDQDHLVRNLTSLLQLMYYSRRGQDARAELDFSDGADSDHGRPLRLVRALTSEAPVYPEIFRQTTARRKGGMHMATTKIAKKKRSEKKLPLEGLSPAEAKEILKTLSPKLKKRLKSFW